MIIQVEVIIAGQFSMYFFRNRKKLELAFPQHSKPQLKVQFPYSILFLNTF